MTADPPSASDLPDALTNRSQWLCWRRQDRDDKQTKVPIDPTTGKYASATDSDTWTDLERARDYVAEGRADGIGFAFTEDDPIVGVDLDDCRDPATGEHDSWAEDIIETLDSYTEISPSGTGYHVLVEGHIPGDRSRSGDVEIYETDRFFTVTGDHVPSTPDDVQPRADELASVYDQYLREESDSSDTTDTGTPAASSDGDALKQTHEDTVATESHPVAKLSDEELLERARAAANGPKFRALWRGSTSGYESHSEADMALCSLLAFWTGGDADRIDALFRDSGLMREKWDEVHYSDGSTYGEKTIERAIDGTNEFYDPATPSDTEDEAPSLSNAPTGDHSPSTASPSPGRAPTKSTDAQLDIIQDLEAELQRLEAENRELQAELKAERAKRRELEAALADGDDSASLWTRLGFGSE